MGSFWRTALLAGLASLLLASSGKRLANGAGTPHEIGTGLDTMVLVPAGWFIRGSTPQQAEAAYREGKKIYNWYKKEWFDAEVPLRRIHLDTFYIDKYPVTNARFRRSGKPAKDYGSKFNGARQPVVGVTWYQARDYCGSVGKRLPTEAEWEKATRGVDGRKYPWGNDWADGSNVIWSKNSGKKTHPVDRTYNTHRSPFGVVDMSGNVLEWVADWYAKDYYRNASERNPKGPEGPASGVRRVVRGGSSVSTIPTDLRAANRFGVRAQHDAAAGHGVEHRPGQDEGHGEVDVQVAQTEDLGQFLFGQSAQKQDPL